MYMSRSLNRNDRQLRSTDLCLSKGPVCDNPKVTLIINYLSVSHSFVPGLYLYVGGNLRSPSWKLTKHLPSFWLCKSLSAEQTKISLYIKLSLNIIILQIACFKHSVRPDEQRERWVQKNKLNYSKVIIPKFLWSLSIFLCRSFFFCSLQSN